MSLSTDAKTAAIKKLLESNEALKESVDKNTRMMELLDTTISTNDNYICELCDTLELVNKSLHELLYKLNDLSSED